MKPRALASATALGLLLLSGTAQAVAQRRPPAVESLRKLPLNERRKALEGLPPDRRKEAESRLDRLNALSPRERDSLERRYEEFQKLPPRRQQQARMMFRQFNDLPPKRHAAVEDAMHLLRRLPPSGRADWLESPQFQRRFGRREQEILRTFESLLPPAAAPSPDRNE